MAAAQWPEASFIPKQAQPKSPELYEIIIGNSSERVAQHILTSRLQPVQPNAVIHDNGCGTLQASSQLFTHSPICPSPSTNLRVYATDSNAQQISFASTKALTNGWPIKTFIMNSESLTFPDSTFDLSFTNFVIMGLDPSTRGEAAKNLYRTLKPGGTAVVVTWAYMPHDLALKKAHIFTRSQTPQSQLGLRIKFGDDLLKESFLKDFYGEGGFEEKNIAIKPFEFWHEVPDLRKWAEGLWSFLGDTEEGWTKEDEERWDEALGIVVDEVKRVSAFVESEDGKGGKLRFVAHVGLGMK